METPSISHETLRGERKFRKYWNLLVLLGIFWYAITIPIFISMDINSRGWLLVIDLLWTLFFCIDIYLNFNTPYLTDGEWVTDTFIIRRRYLRSWFGIDVIATIPFDLLLLFFTITQSWIFSAIRVIRIFRAIRLFRLKDVVVNLSTHGKDSLITDIILETNVKMKVTLLLFWVIIGLNVIACGWVMISPQYRIGNHFDDYVMGLYWTVTTLTTVGYGDMTPVSSFARIYTMFVMLVGVVMYGLVIGNISTMMINHKAHKNRQREKMVELANFLKDYKIPKHMQSSIFSYYNHYLFEKDAKNSQIVADLPQVLQREINTHVNVVMLRHVPIFAHASQECLSDMVKCLKRRSLTPHEQIITHGDIGQEMYFLSHGVVEVQLENGRPVAKLRSGAFFGETALLKEEPRNATVQSITFCDLFVLSKKDFLRVMSVYPDFQEVVMRTVETRQI